MSSENVQTSCKRAYTMHTVSYGTKGPIITDNQSPALTLYLEEFEGRRGLFGAEIEQTALSMPVKLAGHNVATEIDDFIEILL